MQSEMFSTAPSPNEELARRIVEALRARGLVPPARAAIAQEKIASGTARANDWQSWVDVSRGRRPGDG